MLHLSENIPFYNMSSVASPAKVLGYILKEANWQLKNNFT